MNPQPFNDSQTNKKHTDFYGAITKKQNVVTYT